MEVVVAAETVLLVLLLVLVAGLLRSHAEILRRLGPAEEQPAISVVPPSPGRSLGAAHDVAGVTPEGDAVALGLSGGGAPTLLAFLTSGCDTCLGFWQALDGAPRRELPEGVRVVAVAKGADQESPARLADLAPADAPVVMSTEAWGDYAVPGAPYFVYVDAAGRVGGEGVATAWPQLTAMLRDALADTEGGTAGERRGAEVDRALEAAGIRPGDPSLYPDA